MGLRDAWRGLAGGAAVREIAPRALHARLGDDPLVLDVRTALEFAASRIPGALHAPLLGLEDALDRLQAAGALRAARPTFAICLSAHRSVPAVRALHARGEIGRAHV